MILILGGTTEGRLIADKLSEKGFTILYSVTTDYAQTLVDSRVSTRVGRLNSGELEDLVLKNHIDCIIDLTHPYAELVTETAKTLAEKLNLLYLRYERPECQSNNLLRLTETEIVSCLKEKQGKVLLTTGSKNLKLWKDFPKDRLVIRILPLVENLKKASQLGFTPDQIIACQGPFTYLENVSQLKRYKIKYLVTKSSGAAGGFIEKVNAANDCGVTIFVVKRPSNSKEEVFSDIDLLLEYLYENYA